MDSDLEILDYEEDVEFSDIDKELLLQRTTPPTIEKPPNKPEVEKSGSNAQKAIPHPQQGLTTYKIPKRNENCTENLLDKAAAALNRRRRKKKKTGSGYRESSRIESSSRERRIGCTVDNTGRTREGPRPGRQMR